MKKKIMVFLVIMMSFSITIIYNHKTTFKIDNVTYAATLDGKDITSIPSKGDYSVAVKCKNATGKWLYDEWLLRVTDITDTVTCSVSFTTITNKNYLNSYVTSLAGTVQGTGEVVKENGYRYEGKNPNNYIWFNNELWRVIGIFDTTLADGTTVQNLTKIIRNNIVSGLTWDNGGRNNWNTSSLKALLNGAYYNREDGTSSGYCYGKERITSNCDYTAIGISNTYRPMIKNVTWNLGGLAPDNNSVLVDAMYDYERGTRIWYENSATGTGYIGLMYPSDYGYSVLASSCARTTYLNIYSTNSCAGSSWLYSASNEWLLTPTSDLYGGVYCVFFDGGSEAFDKYGTNTGISWRPVLYLDSGVYIKGGEGTMLDPYIVAM